MRGARDRGKDQAVMTVKVVGHEKDLKRRIVCRSCSAILEFVDKDMERVKCSHMGEDCVDGWLKCPECAADVRVGCL